MTSHPTVTWVTVEDLEAGILRALEEFGLTMEEVVEQGERYRFTSEDARRVWFLIDTVRLIRAAA